MTQQNRHIGSSLESLFDELGEAHEFRMRSQKKVFVLAASQRMADLHMSKNMLARRMATSRPAIDRLLDPDHTSLTFATLGKAALVLGLEFRIEFTEATATKPARRSTKKPVKSGGAARH